jgi:malic enzyme
LVILLAVLIWKILLRQIVLLLNKNLKEILDIPVFHDDQHGTAIITTAALINALDISKKKIKM